MSVAKILPLKSVGVQGDSRSYKHPVVLFDFPRDWEKLNQLATQITNRFSEINRVLIVLQADREEELLSQITEINAKRIKTLQLADKIVHDQIRASGLMDRIWQFPVVLLPVGKKKGEEAIVLRPVDSQEAMTASFSRIAFEILEKITTELLQLPGISSVFFDITNKPPGTIEWE